LIWDKDGAAAPAPRVQRFLTGDDLSCDRVLLPYDLTASRAHVAGLARIGALGADEAAALDAALAAIGADLAAGALALDDAHEDGHSAIEAWLVERLGAVGKKVHLGRSRNDQVLAALRLYLRDALDVLTERCAALARVFLDRAAAEAATAMPGYTHLQRAVPSSAAMWLASFAEAFVDDAALAGATRAWIDSSPLGAAAGYGVNLPLDRAGVAAALGHARVQLSPIYAQSSRGKVELQVLTALWQALCDVRRLAWDLGLFATAEFGFVRLPDEMTTGSSIMPQKRNPDVVELLRAAPAAAQGAMAEIAAVLSLPSGYHRDLQATKPPTLRALAAGLEALAVAAEVAAAFTLDRERMRAAITPEMFATDRAVDLARAGVPFRDAYRQVAAELERAEPGDPDASLAARTSPGGAAALGLDELERRLAALAVR
jgi:argininosuccinate lyase